jgi:site-specific recombinase XerD
VKGPKASPPTPKRLPDSKLQEMRQRAEARASDGSFVHVRNLMIFEFLLATGIRVDELRTMKLAQLTQDHQWCRNVKCKGQTYRNVYLKSGVRSLLKKYLAEREQELRRVISKLDRITDSGLPLFPSVYGASATDPESFRMGSKTLWRAISDLAPGVSPHALRHTFAHWLLEATGDLRLVAQALGHSDVRVTMRYTEREDDSIAEAIEGAGS